MEKLKQNLLSEQAVAEQLALSLSTLRNWRCKGRGPAYFKMGRAVRYNEKDILAYQLSRRIVPQGEQ